MALKTIGFRGSDHDRAQLEAQAKARDISLSDYIRRCLELEAVHQVRKYRKGQRHEQE